MRKLTIKSIWLCLFIIGFGVTGCGSVDKITVGPTTIITQSIASTKVIQESTPTINPTPTFIPKQEYLPTEIPTQTINPTIFLACKLQLTYITHNNGKYDIYAVSIGCPEKSPPCLGKPELLFEYNSTIYNISWSPDGKQLVFFAVGNGGKGDIFVADWNGKNIRNITNSPDFESWPTWTPDGTRIGYTRCSDGKCQFISVKPDGSDPVRLLEKADVALLSAVWSPDMSHILMSGNIEGGFNQIYISEIDGSNLQKLTNNLADLYSQTYSPDGLRIAFGQFFGSEQLDKTDIYILNLVNNELDNLTNGIPPYQGSVQWSNFGNWLAFQGEIDGISNIYLIRPDGSDLIEVTQGNQGNYIPAWRRLP